MEKCVYCLKKLTKQNKSRDHILPRSWFNADTDKNQAVTVPSCFDCNQNFQKSEDELFVRFAMTINSNTGDISIRGMLKMFPLMAIDKRSFGRKMQIFNKVTKDFKRYQEFNEEVIFRPKSGRSMVMIRYPYEHLHNVVKKFISALEFRLRANYLGKRRSITFWLYGVDKTNEKDVRTQNWDYFLDKKGTLFSIGKDFNVIFVANLKYKDQVIYRITLWETFQFYCFIHNRTKNQLLINQIPINSRFISN